MLTSTLQPRILALADRAERLCPNHRDPERFHIEKSELANDLRRLGESLTRDHEVYGVYQSIMARVG